MLLFSINDPWYFIRSTFDIMESRKIQAEQDRAYEECLKADRAIVSSYNYILQGKKVTTDRARVAQL